jgi:hypothetical protein
MNKKEGALMFRFDLTLPQLGWPLSMAPAQAR